jgi:hypothetical protein
MNRALFMGCTTLALTTVILALVRSGWAYAPAIILAVIITLTALDHLSNRRRVRHQHEQDHRP